jgi:hypothetical protein
MNRIAMATCGVAVVGLLAAGAATSHAAPIIDELQGNLFHQNGAPHNGNVSIAVNNTGGGGSNGVTGGNWVGGDTTHYPINDASPILDGDLSTAWNSGTVSDPGMLNVGITQGYYGTDPNNDGFTTVPFSKIAIIRIWASDYINDFGPPKVMWQSLPVQVKVGYTTAANFDSHDGNKFKSSALGILPASWDQEATITAVNGVSSSTVSYGSGTGWTDLTGDFITTPETDRISRGYVDLTVNIPAGATSVLLSFGQINTSTGNQGGLVIRDIQASSVPEPTTFGLLAVGSLALLRRRQRLQ